MTITEIVTNIDRRLADARAELTHLQGARAALVNGAQPVARPAAARPAAAPKARAAAAKATAAAPKATAAAAKAPAAAGPAAAAKAPAAAPKARTTTRKPSRAARQVVPVGKLTALLSGSEGMRTRELATATSGDPTRILALLKEQEVAGEVRRSGIRAATRWHLITDEDRIAARAAELAARSKPKRARKN